MGNEVVTPGDRESSYKATGKMVDIVVSATEFIIILPLRWGNGGSERGIELLRATQIVCG